VTATPPVSSIADELAKLAALKDSGVISAEEFIAYKAKAARDRLTGRVSEGRRRGPPTGLRGLRQRLHPGDSGSPQFGAERAASP
jgi:hypothetical protein